MQRRGGALLSLCEHLLAAACGGGALAWARSFPYPLNAALYEQLLGACVDDGERGAALHPRAAEMMQAVAAARPALCITELMHSLACVVVRFEEPCLC
jgi:hypothetical protein